MITEEMVERAAQASEDPDEARKLLAALIYSAAQAIRVEVATLRQQEAD